MKKIFAIAFVVIMMFSLCACGQSEAAKAADDAIMAIGTVSLESKPLIENADSLVKALSEDDYKQVKGLEDLEKAKNTFEALSIEDSINSIGTVTLNSKDLIDYARQVYDNAEEAVKSEVSNYQILEAAEKKYEEAKNAVLEEKIKSAEKAIAAIGTVTLDSASVIIKAEDEYNALDSSSKNKVSNYKTLVAAKKEYKKLLSKSYQSAVSRMDVENDEVQAMKFYSPKRMPYYINSRCSMLPYIGMGSGSTNNWIMIRYNYAGDDWVFFRKATIAVDDQRYYQTFNYYDITHNHAGGMVGESIDIEATEEDIAMLRQIVSSKKTTVRFEGNDYYHDYVLTDSDKSAIKDVLIMYDYLNLK
ncbi:MAG: lipoprotein [Acutalibacteraceae bacterium]